MRWRLAALACLASSLARAAFPAQARIPARAPLEVLERLDGLRQALEQWHPELEVAWIAQGSSADFSGLFDGSIDLLLSSRSISAWERALSERLGLDIREQVLAFDAVAVIVHPDNPVASLSLEQLDTLFRGKIVGWYGFGGSDRAVRLLSPPPSSGEFQVLQERLLGEGSELPPQSEFIEHPSDAVGRVAADPGAVALVPMSVDRSRVRTVPLETDESGEYPLGRGLWLYTRGTPDESLRRLLSCLLSTEGQAEMVKAGFTAMSADRAVQRELTTRSRSGGARVTRVSFALGASGLDGASRRILADLSESALRAGVEVWVTGHSDLQEERPGAGNGLSEARARAVEAFLEERGVGVAGAEGVGSIEPRTAGSDARRAEVWWLSRR